MMKKATVGILFGALFLFSGCDSTTSSSATDATGPSSGSSQTIGSMSGSEDISAYLEDGSWSTITLDLDKYLYDMQGSLKDYTIDMIFAEGKVTVLADCNRITASYKIKEDEISFSRISSPKPALDLPTCTEFKDADNAVLAFFSSDYIVKPNRQDEVLFKATDIETSVTLTR